MSSKSFIILLFIFSFISASEYTELSYLESKEIPFDKKEFLIKIDLSQYHQNNLENIYFNIKFNKAHKYGRILYAYGDSNSEDLKYNGQTGYNDVEDDNSKTVFHLIPVNKDKKFVFVKVLFFWFEEKIKSNLVLKIEKEGIKTEKESFEFDFKELEYLGEVKQSFKGKEYYYRLNMEKLNDKEMEYLYFSLNYNKKNKFSRILYCYSLHDNFCKDFLGKVTYKEIEEKETKTVFYEVPFENKYSFLYLKVMFYWESEEIPSEIIFKSESKKENVPLKKGELGIIPLDFLGSAELPLEKNEYYFRIDLSEKMNTAIKKLFFSLKYNKANKFGRIQYCYTSLERSCKLFNTVVSSVSTEEGSTRTVYYEVPFTPNKKYCYIRVAFYWLEPTVKSNFLFKHEVTQKKYKISAATIGRFSVCCAAIILLAGTFIFMLRRRNEKRKEAVETEKHYYKVEKEIEA